MWRIRAHHRLHGSPHGMPRLPRRRDTTMSQERLFPMPQIDLTGDDYWTPEWIFDAIGIEFDLDVACPPEGPLHTPAKAFYTQETDGLVSPWFGKVWMNPPFSKTNHWALKFIEHKNGVCLVPMSKSKWFDALWQSSEGVLCLPSNFRFEGRNNGSIFIACAMFAYGKSNVTALHNSKIGRVR